jgi:hypothetical protein
VWAAKPEYNGTFVGQLDTRTLRWVHQEHLPNLKFETKHLWVDESERNLYAVYKGHVLRLPMEESQ